MKDNIEIIDAGTPDKSGRPARCTPSACKLYDLFGGRVCRYAEPHEERTFNADCKYDLTQDEANDIALLHPAPVEKVEVKRPPRFGFLKN